MAKSKLNEWSLALLRVVLGVIFAYHGYMKLFVPGGFTGTVGFFTALGLPLPLYSALVVSFLEFFGGLLLLIGLLTRWVLALLIIEMLLAFFKVHLGSGFFISQTSYGYEYLLLILASLVVLLASGTGRLSFGKMFKSKKLQ